MKIVVIDTSVFVSALRSSAGASRVIVRQALLGELTPMTPAEYLEAIS